MKLESTRVYRGGVTSPYRSLETDQVKAIPVKSECLVVSFDIASKGGGKTNIELKIRPADFHHLTAAMVGVDRQAAMEALSAQLADQIKDQPKLDRLTAKQAVAKLCGAASSSYMKAPVGNDGTEKTIMNGVKGLAAQLGY